MVMGDNSCSKGHGFESWCHILGGHFFTLICCNNYIVGLKIPKINKKEAGVGPFKKLKLDQKPFCMFGPMLRNISSFKAIMTIK